MYIKKWKGISFLLAICMLFSLSVFFTITSEAAATELLITGTGIHEEIRITAADWSKYQLAERFYSTNNSLNFHKIVKAKGYDLFELIGADNLKTDRDYTVKFTCADGFEFTKSISELKNAYYTSDFTEAGKVKTLPMIAKYTAVLADFPKDSFSPPVTWKDRSLTDSDLDKDFPKLIFGQTSIDDMNMSKWGKEVVKITIGDESALKSEALNSSYKHISYTEAPYNIDAISSATFTVEGPAVAGYRAISLRQIEEDIDGQERITCYEKIKGKIVQNTYEGINVKYLIDNYVKVKSNAGNVVFKNKSRQPILTVPIAEVGKYTVAYGINGVPLVYLDTDVGYREDQYNDNGCFKLVYKQEGTTAEEFSNVAYIYIEEKDAKNIYEHTYAPYKDPKYTDYEIIIHGDKMNKEVRYKVSDIEAMKDIQVEKEYSLSNSEYFWYYNKYKGATLWELLLKAGIDPNIDESTSIQFIAADNYNFAPMTIKEIKDSSLYGYYEKDALDKGDGTFKGDKVKPLHSGMPVLVAYGFNGYPYVIRPTDNGFNAGLGNDGGPLRVIFGKRSYNDTNGSNQVQFLKEIIIGGGMSKSTGTVGSGEGQKTYKDVAANASWNHNQGVYAEYLDKPVLRITGSQVKEPMTFTLEQIESMTQYAIRDIYTGDGIREFEGITLWDLLSEVVGLKDGVEAPSIRVFSGENYNQVLRSNEQVVNGVLNSQGNLKKIILAYAVEGYPLVPNEGSTGYDHNNAYGPLRLIVEESKSMWVKWVDCIVVGTGDYEVPEGKDVKALNLPEEAGSGSEKASTGAEIWITYNNNTGKELPEASIRSMEFDKGGNLWIGTNNGGVAVRTPEGSWTNIKKITTENAGTVTVDTTYAIVQRENGELWMTLGGVERPQGILMKDGEKWKLLNTENSPLPSNFVQELELDGKGGLWIGTGNGAVYVDKHDTWKVYNKENGLLLSSVDAIEPDANGGVWIGFYPEAAGTEDNPQYIGAYQYIDKDGKITTYTNFENKSFGTNWVRSISTDSKGGVWITRSGNYQGQGHGEVDYILNGARKVYQAKELYPGIAAEDDIRFVLADKETEGTIYIATHRSGLLVSKEVGKIAEKIDSSNTFPARQWDNIYFIDLDEGNLFVGTNGGAALCTKGN
ncbi:two-component regulator propeller domain-containing protein [Geosporobacter ferrireducens]|uniref:Two component regulator propeller n=1 Tax=Geosporobacter ferrireducens TaxID=1424294 RepID=A0A1D8GF90_9FIRM|nr:two-component regulator propeller domain-containing protein [Geosporobacter ferrireducens]AOT69563.1 hypothetical protein Gferi_08215 [Geosporobacter ferrireducens]